MKNQDPRRDVLPYAQPIRWLTYLSVLTAPLLLGFVFGLVAVYLTDKDNRLYQSFANSYSETALISLKKQKKFALFGLAFSFITLSIILYCFFTFGTANPSKIIQLEP